MKDKLLYQKLCEFVGRDDEYTTYHKHEVMVFSTVTVDQILSFFSEQARAKANISVFGLLKDFRLPFDSVAVEFELSAKYSNCPARILAFVSAITLDSLDDGADDSRPAAITAEVFAGRTEIEARKGFLLKLGNLKFVYPVDNTYNDSIRAYLDDQYGVHNVVTRIGNDNGEDFSTLMVPSSLACSVAAGGGIPIKEMSLRTAIEVKENKLETEMQVGSSYGWAALCLLDFLNRNRSGLKQYAVTPKQTVKDKMNRGKKRGARRYTHVYLDKVEYIKNDAPVMRTDIQAHMVRGHFKRKKNGIFWWNPFVRGRGKLNKREAYIVKESADERSPVVVQQDQSVREVPEAVLSPQGGEGLRGAGDGGHALRHSVSRGL